MLAQRAGQVVGQRFGEVELAWDRPFEEWPRYGSENPAFLDAPLDIDELLTVAR